MTAHPESAAPEPGSVRPRPPRRSSPDDAPAPVGYTTQDVCAAGCSTPPAVPTPASVAPSSGAAGGTVQVVPHGTGLNLGDVPGLSADGSAAGYGQAVSVDSAGTELTVQLNLTGVASDTSDVTPRAPAYLTVTLPGAYAVTAVPALSCAAHATVAGLIVVPVSAGLAGHCAS